MLGLSISARGQNVACHRCAGMSVPVEEIAEPKANTWRKVKEESTHLTCLA